MSSYYTDNPFALARARRRAKPPRETVRALVGHRRQASRELYMTGLSISLRPRLFEAQDGLCYLCARRLAPLSKDKTEQGSSFDHVQPVLWGGRAFQNLLLSHPWCNAEKGSRRPYPCELLFLAAVNARLSPFDWAPLIAQGSTG
jgi:hypothetical protein